MDELTIGRLPECKWIKSPVSTVAVVLQDYMSLCGKLVYEPGCGDGSLLAACAAREAKVIGCENNPILASMAMRTLWPWRRQAEIYETDMLSNQFYINHADMVYCYLMHGLTEKLVNHLLAHGWYDGTLVSHNYPLITNYSGAKKSYGKLIKPIHEAIIYHGLDKYPPYSILSFYRVKGGKLEGHIKL